MIRAAIIVMLVAAVFAAAVLNLAMESRARGVIMKIAILCAVGVGAVYYGSGYAMTLGLTPTALIRALLATCRMFGGVNDIGGISGSALLRNEAGTAVFWLGHFFAFYVTASAAIATLGERLLRRIRVKLLRRGPLLLIYGVNGASVAYGRSMSESKKRPVLFVDPDGNTSFESTIKSFGAVLDKSEDALTPGERFLQQINMGPGNRQLELAAMHADGNKNYTYAKTLLDAMTAAGIKPEQTRLIIAGAGGRSSEFQAFGETGYGSVLAYDDHELTARLIVRDYPPCDRIRFGEDGKAKEDFHAVIIGYGRMGRAILSQIVCNAQFCGSHFRADVFDPGPQNGFLYGHNLMKNYDIRFHNADARNEELYSFLEDHEKKISMIVVCTGKADDNREIVEDLAGWYEYGRTMPMIVQASKGSYSCIEEDGTYRQCANIYKSDVLDISKIDAMAMQINHMYCGENGQTAEGNWEKCDYFNRLSSRASADFYPAMLRAAGRTAEQVLAGEWPPEENVLENLAITEHMRWCAFHHAMGIEKMPESVFEERAAAYQEEVRQNGKSSIRIAKDLPAHQHACLIPWEELDALSARENAVTGGDVDYKQMDRNNVLAISEVLAAMKNAE